MLMLWQCNVYKMGNSNVTQHIETAQKTGVCQLCKVGLKEVELIKKSTIELNFAVLSCTGQLLSWTLKAGCELAY